MAFKKGSVLWTHHINLSAVRYADSRVGRCAEQDGNFRATSVNQRTFSCGAQVGYIGNRNSKVEYNRCGNTTQARRFTSPDHQQTR